MKNREHDVSKLPGWAQAEIQKLGLDVIYWKEKALSATEGQAGAGTDTFLKVSAGECRKLPRSSVVMFGLLGGLVKAQVLASGSLRIASDDGECLLISPETSGSFCVRVISHLYGSGKPEEGWHGGAGA
jgi:hypothetical protein